MGSNKYTSESVTGSAGGKAHHMNVESAVSHCVPALLTRLDVHSFGQNGANHTTVQSHARTMAISLVFPEFSTSREFGFLFLQIVFPINRH